MTNKAIPETPHRGDFYKPFSLSKVKNHPNRMQSMKQIWIINVKLAQGALKNLKMAYAMKYWKIKSITYIFSLLKQKQKTLKNYRKCTCILHNSLDNVQWYMSYPTIGVGKGVSDYKVQNIHQCQITQWNQGPIYYC